MEEPATEPPTGPATGPASEPSPPPQPHEHWRATESVLRPAFCVWLLMMLIYGLVSLGDEVLIWLDAYIATGPFSSSKLLATAGQIAAVVVVVKFVWPVPEARRVFGKLPKRALEFGFVVTVALVLVFKLWLDWLAGDRLADPYSQSVSAFEMGWMLVTYAILPALAEEWMCRGLMLHQFRQVVTLPLANAMQAALFASLHAYTGFMLFYFCFGYVLGMLRLQSNVLWAGMALHGLWDASWLLKAYDYM